MTAESPATMRPALAVALGLIICGVTGLRAQAADPPFLIIRERKVDTFQTQVQQAADRGYRVAGTFVENGYGVVLAKTTGETALVEYLVLSTQKTGTLDSEFNKAASTGYRLTSVLNGMTILMERTKGAIRPTHQYSVLATELRQTIEEELRGPAAVGFRVVAQSRSFGGVIRDKEFMVVLERPIAEAERVRTTYRLVEALKVSTRQREIQDAAELGYRLRASQGRWASAALLEKPVGSDDPQFEYLVLSTLQSTTMQKEMDDAAAQGYHYADTIGGGVGGQTALVMERKRGFTTRTHEQRLFPWKGFTFMGKRSVDAERDLLAELSQGFRLMDQADFVKRLSLTGAESFLILERPVELSR